MYIVDWLARFTRTLGNPRRDGPPPDGASSRLLQDHRRVKRRFRFRDIRPTPSNIFCVVMFYLGWINIMVFVAMAFKLGGDALNGTVIDGHYMLNSHGRLHEVSASVFRYSFWHGLSLFVTQPLAIFCIWRVHRDVARSQGD